jgi:membrane-bound serine protease (ClpP class)
MIAKLLCSVVTTALMLVSSIRGGAQPSRVVDVVRVEGVINPVSADFITDAIKEAEEKRAEAMILILDTPGGLMESMRQITKTMLNSNVPVIVYVAPSGARAASAGVFVTYAANLAAMAPGTNIGAAHPVSVTGGADTASVMYDKITNDAVAQIKALAEKRGRNAQWAEEAVRESVSVTDSEALKKGIINYIAPTLDSLLILVDGVTVELPSGPRTLDTRNVAIHEQEMGWREKLLDRIADPNVAYILLLIGIYGIFFELWNPGAILPGVVGAMSLVLAFFALQILPVNWAGLILIILAIILFILEVKITSYGLLTIGGIISMLVGSLMLFKTPGVPFEPVLRVSRPLIIAAVATTAVVFILVMGLVVKAHRAKVTTGKEGLVGELGVARTDIAPEGDVQVHGEIWRALSDTPIQRGQKVRVVSLEGLVIKVEAANLFSSSAASEG